MPTDEQQRERELLAYMAGYDSRNAEVQALKKEVQNLRVSLRDGSAWAKWATERDALAGGEKGEPN